MVAKNQITEDKVTGEQYGSLYLIGGIAAFIVILASLSDIVISIILSSSHFSIPQSAIDRFAQFHGNSMIGLYYLDLLNMTTAIIMIPAFLALCAAHFRDNRITSAFAMVVFSIGTAIFVGNNVALPMLALSGKYSAAASDAERNLFAAAGEALLARGAHGSPGAFPGFLLPVIASLMISLVMLKGGVFSKVNAYLGIAGSVFFMFYFVLVTFVPGTENLAMAVATPGGLLTIAWMTLYAIRLLNLRMTVRQAG